MSLKDFLYFGLGTLSLFPFALRFFIQWFLSERKKESHVTLIFWHLSAVGNILITLHYLAQVQYHLYFIRFFPLYFGFRQIALMKGQAKPFSWKRFTQVMVLLSFALTALFMLRVHLEYHSFIWIKNLQMPWQELPHNVSAIWHAFGFFGASLFMSRIFVQWWQSEKKGQSYLSKSFWWISVIGGSLTLIYALTISDYVTACGYITGLIPYIRNLMLMRQKNLKPTQV